MAIRISPHAALSIDELLELKDETDFLDQTYQILLRRKPDLAGLESYLSQLKSGIERIDVVAQISGSGEARKWGTPPQGFGKLPSSPADSIEELLSYRGDCFVLCAYLTILGRKPDLEGRANYVTLLRDGLNKLEILEQLVNSAEGRALHNRPKLRGLHGALRKHRLLKLPLIGKLFQLLGLGQDMEKRAGNLRFVENQLRLQADISADRLRRMGNHFDDQFSIIEHKLSESRRELHSQIDRELGSIGRLIKDRNVAADRLAEVVQRVEHAVSQSPTANSIKVGMPAQKLDECLLREKEESSARKNTSLPDYASRVLSKRLDRPIPGDRGILRDTAKLITFYLPQFHDVKENSEWWGPGFTEWTNTANAKPNFDGHVQPHVPRELGFYDLSDVNVMRRQAELAQQYGIHGFCFYYYWFSGRRILEKPLNNFLASDINMPFCVCWANENWTRTWDGDEKSVLLEQRYAEGDEERFIEDTLPLLSDPRYIKVDGKPMLLVYRIKQLPEPKVSMQKWRNAAVRLGLKGLHIAVVDFYDIADPREVDADSLVEFPPHKFNGSENHPSAMPRITNSSFAGGIVDYEKIVAQSARREKPDFELYRGIIPGWDNTARRQDTPLTVINHSPERFGAWLNFLRRYTRLTASKPNDSFLFVNAWNEWGEGCHLEPDLHWGMRYLEETLRSSWFDSACEDVGLEGARRELALRMQELSHELTRPA